MEDVYNGLRRTGADLYSDTSDGMRLKQRPIPSKGKGFEDIGSDFVKSKRSSSSMMPMSNSRIKGKTKLDSSYTAVTHLGQEKLSSDDEIDFLSQRSVSRDKSSSPKKKTEKRNLRVNGGTRRQQMDVGERAFVNGTYHDYHPDYKPRTQTLPSFKKKKISNNEPDPASQPSQTSASSTNATVGSLGLSSPSPSPSPSPPPPPRASASRPAPRSTHAGARKPAAGRREKLKEKQSPLNELSSNRGRTPAAVKSDGDGTTKTPRPTNSQRPMPRPAYKGGHAMRSSQSPEPRTHSADDEKAGCTEPTPDRNRRRQPCDFPNLSPLVSGTGSKTKATGKGKEKEQTDPISTLSPLSSQTQGSSIRDKVLTKSKKPLPQAFPMDSPLPSSAMKSHSQSSHDKEKSSSQQGRLSKGKGRAVVLSSAESGSGDDEGDGGPPPSNYQIRPFPMETQILESIGFSPGKRASEDDSDAEGSGKIRQERKKRRADPNEILAELLRSDDMSDFDEEDLLFLNPNTDPKTLCPWCDEQLPPVPTPHLSSLIAMARDASWPDARPTNALGLRATLGAFVGVCQRHRFESHQVPLAQQRGWPVEIEWHRVSGRVEALRQRLQEILDDVDEDFLPGASRREDPDDKNEGEDEDDDRWAERPRKGSVFWRNMVQSVKKKGSRQTAGVAGQFASFNKMQPGYYGELGYVILHQTIYNLFPPTSFDPDSILPLIPTDFIQCILVPEAAISLIMEDMGQTRMEAIATLRESAQYGVAMFPDDHSEGADAVDAGDQIIMKRAQERRKELELEERLEEEMWKACEGQQVDNTGMTKAKGKRRERPRMEQKESETGEVEVDDMPVSKKGKRKERVTRKAKSKPSGTDAETENDVIMLTDSETSTTKRTKTTKAQSMKSSTSSSKACSTVMSSDVEMVSCDGTHSGTGPKRPVSRPKPRRKVYDTEIFPDKQPEKENMPTSDSADSDVQVPRRPTSNQAPTPHITWDHKGKPYVDGKAADTDATPMRRKLSQTSSCSSTDASAGLERKPVYPLQKARDRCSQLNALKLGTTTTTWSHSLRDRSAESTEDESASTVSDVPRSPNHIRTERSQLVKDNFKWLLNDTPGSSQ